jgi:uncharacterized membrane protein
MPSSPERSRLDSIDVARGLIMVLMLLDHTRDFTHQGAFVFDPLDAARTTPWLYATRWITHLCAPGFVLLAGLSVGLKRVRGMPGSTLSRFLLTRGLWFVFLEIAVFRYLIWANLDTSFLVHLQVIWSIGVSMIVMSALVRLPTAAIVAIGAAIVLGHNTLDGIRFQPWRGPGSPAPEVAAKIWMVLHQGGFFPIAGAASPVVFANYPVLPWIGIMALGVGLAAVYGWPPDRRRVFLLSLSAAMALGFFVLRWSNLYGDPRRWSSQADPMKTAMVFMNVAKYPPSLLFTLITLVPTLGLLALLDGRSARGGPPSALVTFGCVPFFFYVLQWPTARLAGIIVSSIEGKSIGPYFLNFLQMIQLPQPPDVGGPLWMSYLAWIAGVCLLYWPCRWFASVKARRRDWWLSYV